MYVRSSTTASSSAYLPQIWWADDRFQFILTS